MQLLHKLEPKKTWRLARNTVTGQIYTDWNSTVYCGKPDQQQAMIDRAKAKKLSTGEITPDYMYARKPYRDNCGCCSDIELFDHLPVLRVKMRFKHIYNGTSGASIIFKDEHDFDMTLRTGFSDQFFKLVGLGKIVMDNLGFYEFDVTFSKGGDKVYMELYGY